jgi:hypothetical protein
MKILIFALLSIMSSLLLADNKIEIIQLKNRVASDVLSEIQPFLPKQSTARASNDFIILQATPKIIAQMKQLINTLDMPAQNLVISVIKTDTVMSSKQRTRTDGDILISESGVSADLSVERWSTNNSRNKDQHYQSRGLAGRPIMISTNQALPQVEQYFLLGSNGDRAVQSNTSYIDINNGFQAIANILPNQQVSLDIYPQFASFSKRNGVIDSSQLSSSLSGPVGVWIEMGQASSAKNKTQLGTTRSQTHHQQQQFIYIKVDQLFNNKSN